MNDEASGPSQDGGPLWRVKHESRTHSRFKAWHRDGRVPTLVARRDEIDLLWRHWTMARAGDGSCLLVRGEAGIGKSHLTATLADRVSVQRGLLLELDCSPVHRGFGLYPFVYELRNSAEVDSADESAVIAAKVRSLLTGEGLTNEQSIDALCVLAGGAVDSLEALSPAERRRAILDALSDRLWQRAEHEPLLVIVEDLHWADATTLELLGSISASCGTHKVLLVATHRPEFQPSWHQSAGITTVALNPLEPRAVRELVTQLPNGGDIGDDALERIVSRADGVPLYAEEIFKAAVSGQLAGQGGQGITIADSVPDSIEESLQIRLNRLGNARAVLETCAVIGREAGAELTRRVCGLDEAAFQTAVDRLAEAEVVSRVGQGSAPRLRIRHALLLEICYANIARERLSSLHRSVAECIETLYPETLLTQPEVLAHHHEAAGEPRLATRYWGRAGNREQASSDYEEALSHFRRGFEQLELVADSVERDEVELDLQIGLGPTLVATRGYADEGVDAAYARARLLCERLGRDDQLLGVLCVQQQFYLVRARYEMAAQLGTELLELADHSDTSGARVEGHLALGLTHLYLGEYKRAETHFNATASLYDEVEHGGHAQRFGHDPHIVGLSYGARNQWFLGREQRAVEMATEAIEISRRRRHALSLTQAQALLTNVRHLRNEPELTLESAEQAIAVAEEHGLKYWVANQSMLKGWALAKLGEAERGFEMANAAIRTYISTGAVLGRTWLQCLTAEIAVAANRHPDALRLLTEAEELSAANGEHYHLPDIHRVRGDARLAQGGAFNASEAEREYELSLSVARQLGSPTLELRAALRLARGLVLVGETERAKAMLEAPLAGLERDAQTPDQRNAKVILDAFL